MADEPAYLVWQELRDHFGNLIDRRLVPVRVVVTAVECGSTATVSWGHLALKKEPGASRPSRCQRDGPKP